MDLIIMKRALFVLLAISAASLNGGCQLYHRMHRGHDGCSHGCPDGACAHSDPGQCGSGQCGPGQCGPGQCGDGVDGHPDRYELLHFGHQGPPQRGGVLSWLGSLHGGSGQGGPAANAQPAPGPSAGNVSYPYYTTRGPRDFLAADPRGIGP
jgi:hypothetical protein